MEETKNISKKKNNLQFYSSKLNAQANLKIAKKKAHHQTGKIVNIAKCQEKKE